MHIRNLTSIPLYVMQSDSYGLPTATVAQTIAVNSSISVSQTGEFYIAVATSDSIKLWGKQLATDQSTAYTTASTIVANEKLTTRPSTLHVYYLSQYTLTDDSSVVSDYYCLNGVLNGSSSDYVTFAEITPTDGIELSYSDCFTIEQITNSVLNPKQYLSSSYYGTTETDTMTNHVKFSVNSGKKLTSDITYRYTGGGRNFYTTVTHDDTKSEYEATYSFSAQRLPEKYTLTATYEDAPITITLTNNTSHCNVTMSPTAPTQGTAITVTIKAYSYYYLKTAPTVNGNTVTSYNEASGTNPNVEYTYTLSASDTSNITTVTVAGDAVRRIHFSNNSTLTNCSYSTTPSPVTFDNDDCVLTITANTGYDFVDAGTSNLWVRLYTGSSFTDYYPTLNDAKTVATITFTSSLLATLTTGDDAITIYAIADSSDRSISVSKGTTQDCSFTYTPTSPQRKQPITFTFTPSTGYRFTVAPTVTKVDSSGSTTTYTSTLANHGLTATLKLTNSNTSNAYTLDPYAVAVAISSIEIDFSAFDGHLDSATYTITPSSPKQGDDVTITVTAIDSYWYYNTTVPTVNDTDMTVSDDYLSATISYTSEQTWSISKFTIVAVAVRQPQQIIPTGETSSCGVTFPNIILQGDTVTFLFTANNGYYFVESPTITVTDVSTATETFTGALDKNNTECKITVETKQTTQSIDYYGIAQISPDVPQISYSFINGYVLTNDNLKELAKVRFIEQTTETTLKDASTSSQLQTTVSNTLIDLGQYVTSLKRFYVDIPTSIDATVVLGTMDTKVTAKLVSADTVDIDCGTVHINRRNNNVNDYTNTTAVLFLPFIGQQTIDIMKIMDKDISLTYKVSTISGACVATLKRDSTTIYEFTGNVAERIPYIMNYNEATMLNSYFDVEANTLFDFTPIIVVTYHQNKNINGVLLIADNTYTAQIQTLGGGHYCIEDVIVPTNTPQTIPSDEMDLIMQILQNGIII